MPDIDWKQYAALKAYNALRSVNPHLPPPDLVTADEIQLRMGSDHGLASVILRAHVALPESWQQESERRA